MFFNSFRFFSRFLGKSLWHRHFSFAVLIAHLIRVQFEWQNRATSKIHINRTTLHSCTSVFAFNLLLSLLVFWSSFITLLGTEQLSQLQALFRKCHFNEFLCMCKLSFGTLFMSCAYVRFFFSLLKLLLSFADLLSK